MYPWPRDCSGVAGLDTCPGRCVETYLLAPGASQALGLCVLPRVSAHDFYLLCIPVQPPSGCGGPSCGCPEPGPPAGAAPWIPLNFLYWQKLELESHAQWILIGSSLKPPHFSLHHGSQWLLSTCRSPHPLASLLPHSWPMISFLWGWVFIGVSDVVIGTVCRFVGHTEISPTEEVPPWCNHDPELQKDTPVPTQSMTPNPTQSHMGRHYSQSQKWTLRRCPCAVRGTHIPVLADPKEPLLPQVSGHQCEQVTLYVTWQAGKTFLKRKQRTHKSLFFQQLFWWHSSAFTENNLKAVLSLLWFWALSATIASSYCLRFLFFF